MAETAKVEKSKRELLDERLRSRYPDKEFADDEALLGQVNDDYDNYENELNGYREREQKFSDMFTSDPRSAHFMMAWRDGGDPVVELVRMFGTDIVDKINDPEAMDEIASANKDYLERVAKNKELEEKYRQNLDASLNALGEFQQSHGLSDDEADKVMELLEQIAMDGILGKFSVENMELALKAVNHDADVAASADEAEVRGRNAKIDERLRKRGEGDGTAVLGGTGAGGGRKAGAGSIFDVAQGAR